jgi:hypothetical protein
MTVALEPSCSQICTLGTCIANCLCLVWVKSTVLVFRFMLLGWRCGMKFGLSFIVKHSRTCEHGSNTESLNALSGSNGNWCKCLVALDMSHSFKGTKYCWKIDKHSVFNVLAPRKHDWLQTKVQNLHFPLLMVYWEISSTACFANDCTKLVGIKCYFLKGNFFGGLWFAWILVLVPKHPIPCHLKQGLFLCGSMWCMNPPPLRSCTPPDRKKNHTPTPQLLRDQDKG